jgi:hypothetical protein
MEIRHGWATEYGKDKFDVSVDETDLERLCNEYGIAPAFQSQLTSEMVFTLLDTLARYLSLREAVRMTGDDAGAKHAAVTRAQQGKNVHLEVVRRVKAALGIEEPAGEPARDAVPAASG